MTDSRSRAGEPRSLRGERGGAGQVILIIIGGLVLLAVLAVLVGLWAVKQYVQVEVSRSGGAKRVSIRTPVGDLEIRKAEDVAAELKLPIYPGAVSDDESASVRLRGRLWEEEGGLDVVAASFRTSDDFDQVDAWYQKQLGPDFTREKGHIRGGDHRGGDSDWKIRVEPGGDDVLYSRQREGGVRGVALRRRFGHVRIGLFEVSTVGSQ